MKKVIFKYKVTAEKICKIELPKGAEILCVQTQNDEPYVWCLIDNKAEKEERYFETFGTGHEIHEDMGIERKYVGTFQIIRLGFVFHLFERIN